MFVPFYVVVHCKQYYATVLQAYQTICSACCQTHWLAYNRTVLYCAESTYLCTWNCLSYLLYDNAWRIERLTNNWQGRVVTIGFIVCSIYFPITKPLQCVTNMEIIPTASVTMFKLYTLFHNWCPGGHMYACTVCCNLWPAVMCKCLLPA